MRFWLGWLLVIAIGLVVGGLLPRVVHPTTARPAYHSTIWGETTAWEV